MKLCTPASIYLVLSAIGIILIAFQNYGTSPNLYCVGNVKCPVQTTTPIFIMKILYVVFWTFILNTLCSYGYYKLSWFLLLLPFILFFIMVFLLGTFLNKRTASDPSTNSGTNSGYGYNQAQQAQPSQMNMMRQNSNNVQPPGSEQTHWFLQGNQNNTNAGGGSKQYSSYGDYDGALDQRTNQIYNESHEKNQPTQHYK